MTVRRPIYSAVAAMAALALSSAVFADEASEQKLKATNACVGCPLTNADLTGAQLAGANLTGADLTGATLYGSSLQNATLTKAVLTGADLRNANLRGARGADLSTAFTDERTTCPSGAAGPCR